MTYSGILNVWVYKNSEKLYLLAFDIGVHVESLTTWEDELRIMLQSLVTTSNTMMRS